MRADVLCRDNLYIFSLFYRYIAIAFANAFCDVCSLRHNSLLCLTSRLLSLRIEQNSRPRSSQFLRCAQRIRGWSLGRFFTMRCFSFTTTGHIRQQEEETFTCMHRYTFIAKDFPCWLAISFESGWAPGTFYAHVYSTLRSEVILTCGTCDQTCCLAEACKIFSLLPYGRICILSHMRSDSLSG